MKKPLIFFIIFISVLCSLLSQNAYYLEEYDELKPDINVLINKIPYESSISRSLLLYHFSFTRNDPILFCTMPETAIASLSDEQVNMERKRMKSPFFWDPRSKENYLYCDYGLRDENIGWYLLAFSNNYFTLHLHNRNRYWASQSPPYVQLDESRLFTSQYVYNQRELLPNSHLPAYHSLFKVIEINTNKPIWEQPETRYGFVDMYWITENWYIKKNSPSFISGSWERQNTIYNYETEETISFLPEVIIGYGEGVVLTTTETEEGFIGITVWTPEKEILYRDSTFSLSGIIDHEYGRITWGEPGIDISYFDYPYIYINISRVRSIGIRYAALIMNLKEGRTYYTPLGYHLFGIF